MSYSNVEIVLFNGNASSVCIGDANLIRYTVTDICDAARKLYENSAAEWVLFCDADYDIPDAETIRALTAMPVDVWHAGACMGVGQLPDVLNYVHPTWQYNRNGRLDIEHSSFRLQFKACLLRRSLLMQLDFISKAYRSVEVLGIALGYALMKSGAVMRHTPLLAMSNAPDFSCSVHDEWLFAKQFFTTKWQVWTMLNKPGFFDNLKAWLKSDGVKVNLTPSIHKANVNVENAVYKTVSVLVPTLNRYSYLENELSQLCRQHILPLEVLITDQTKVADRKTIDTTAYPELTIKYFPQEETGQCIAWNKLITEAKGEFILFLGDDADDIKPDFIERLLYTAQRYNCDMVAARVIEAGIPEGVVNQHIYMADTFPITLIKREVVVKAGMLDMFFNRNIRADQELSMRCHIDGALMLFNPSADIFHHRAPIGGLRTHNARAVTTHGAKSSLTKFIVPTSSELYLAKKHFSPKQFDNYVKIKFFNQLISSGSVIRKLLRSVMFIFKLPALRRQYKINLLAANAELAKHAS